MALKPTGSSFIPKTIDQPSSTMKIPRVVHCKRETHDVYIGRPSKYGNPFSHLEDSAGSVKVATREDAVESYRKWVLGEITIPGLAPPTIADIQKDLRGKTLGCWCSPKSCHGDVLMDFANNPIYDTIYNTDICTPM